MMHAVPFLRKHIHSVHHSYHAPFSWAGGVVHPAEDAVVIVCQLLPPALVGCHPLSLWLFLAPWVMFLVEEHSGHHVWWAPWQWLPMTASPLGGGGAPHDVHHYRVNLNFGFVFTVWDRMFGTYAAPVIEVTTTATATMVEGDHTDGEDEEKKKEKKVVVVAAIPTGRYVPDRPKGFRKWWEWKRQNTGKAASTRGGEKAEG